MECSSRLQTRIINWIINLWGKKFSEWEIAKTKANLKPESNMKDVWNTCKRELGGMKSVNAVKNTTKS